MSDQGEELMVILDQSLLLFEILQPLLDQNDESKFIPLPEKQRDTVKEITIYYPEAAIKHDHQLYADPDKEDDSNNDQISLKKAPTNKRRIQERRFGESSQSEAEESDASSIYVADKRRLTSLQQQKVQE